MTLQTLNLTNFRNYSQAEFTFSPTTTLILGPNAAGKTNILEALYFLASGKSFRATYDREVVRGGELAAHVGGEGLEITIVAGENGENTSSKRFKVNGVKKRRADFSGNLRAVYFGPEQILLVTGSPSRRRKYLNSVLVQVDRAYARTLSEYEKVLRQRNRLLCLIREGEQSESQLDFWDERLEKLGKALSEKRREMLEYFNTRLREGSRLMLLFRPRSWSNKKEFREREIAAGMTLWGPHRDDFKFQKNSERRSVGVSEFQIFRRSGFPRHGLTEFSEFSDLSSFGSRGEQRLAILHLKLAELEFIAERAGDRPILLLDDIFSELDEDNRSQVLELLGKQQTIITATDLDQIDGENKDFLVIQL